MSEGEAETELGRACRLFDEGAYHEAHEVLDGLWEGTHGPDADFYRGLIQACIAMHHYRNGNFEGAVKLYAGHRQYLAPYLPEHLGVDLARFLAAMQATLQPVRRARAGEEPRFEPDARPRIGFAPGNG